MYLIPANLNTGPAKWEEAKSVHKDSKQISTPNITKDKQDNSQQKSHGLFSALTLAGGIGLGSTFKDGLNQGLKNIANLTNGVSNIISVPFSLLFPYFILDNERASLRDGKKSKDDLFNRMIYTAASLGFTPNTWGEPLKMGTRSKGHLALTLANLPHMLFTLLSYTGGRAIGCLKAFQLKSNKEEDKQYRLQQEFDATMTLGNLGSAQASVIPMANQFGLGWETITDVFRGDFGSAWDRFKHEPVSVVLGTCFNSWMWPFEYVAKIFDTTIRTAEEVPTFKNAFPEGHFVVRWLEKIKDKWHSNTKDQNSGLGKALKFAREASKIEALIIPPIGMVSVVLPTINRFLRGEFWNKEAQEIGGVVGAFDKIFNLAGFATHMYYTGIYALNVRIPQTITTGAFYLTHAYNWIKGQNQFNADGSLNEKYVDPIDTRERLFNNSFVNKISNWAGNKINNIEKGLHKDPNDQILIAKDEEGNLTGKSRHIRNFAEIMASEVCFIPAKEKLYEAAVRGRFFDEGLDEANGGKIKEENCKPSDLKWAQILKENEDTVIESSKQYLIQYLEKSQLLTKDKVDEFLRLEFEGGIKEEIKKLVKKDIEGSKTALNRGEVNEEEKEVKSKSFLELLTNWTDLKKVLALKTFHGPNTFLPLWIRGFVNVVDFGRRNDPLWLRNLKATETGIREGDVQQACNREFMPVVGYAFQSMGKGMALIHGLGNFLMGRGSMPSFGGNEED